MSRGFKLFLRILLYCFSFLPIFFIVFNIIEDERLVRTITFTLLALEIIITEIIVHKMNEVKIIGIDENDNKTLKTTYQMDSNNFSN